VKLFTFFIGKRANKEAIYVIFLIISIAVLNPPRDSEQQRLEDGIVTFVLVYRMRTRNFGGDRIMGMDGAYHSFINYIFCSSSYSYVCHISVSAMCVIVRIRTDDWAIWDDDPRMRL
jgi:hypothetical protein